MSARHRCPAIFWSQSWPVPACSAPAPQRLQREDKKPVRTIKDLESKEVQVSPDPPSDVKPQQAIEQYRRFLELQSKNEKMRTEAMRRLGDLQVEVDEAARAAGVDSGVEGLELKEAIQLYEGLLKTHPDYPRNDAVMYQLSRAHEAQAQPEKALAVLDQLVTKYPQSPWYTEAQFRRGEILFSAGRYRDAEVAYGAVVKAGSGQRLLRQGLYKHGWSLFKQGRGEESVASFLQGARSRAGRATASCASAIRCRARSASSAKTRCASWRSRSRISTAPRRSTRC